uniref:ATP synthase complex subunit 8 n=1 Tax=Spoladea recurvalis TaxID=1141038 RepID=A0A0H3UC92_9NEOP|nr:ATP synthase F0 subunit 8 [Spoladea recurvalis]AII03048.1 ATP synthase F0 subunit 8 [Spoladea recurvalis]
MPQMMPINWNMSFFFFIIIFIIFNIMNYYIFNVKNNKNNIFFMKKNKNLFWKW